MNDINLDKIHFSPTFAIIDINAIIGSIILNVFQEASRGQLCELITLDVENAVNTTSWNGLLNELQKSGISPYLYNMIDSYFEGRTLLVGEASILEVACATGSGVYFIAYADDLGVVVTGRNVETLETLAEQTLGSIVNCLENKEHKLAAQKTEAVLLTSGRKVKQINVKLRNVSIQSKESFLYLSLHMDRNLRWETQTLLSNSQNR
ncbi:hypothetical protein Trydic_g1057 [Trypoxylus dichotomus]